MFILFVDTRDRMQFIVFVKKLVIWQEDDVTLWKTCTLYMMLLSHKIKFLCTCIFGKNRLTRFANSEEESFIFSSVIEKNVTRFLLQYRLIFLTLIIFL